MTTVSTRQQSPAKSEESTSPGLSSWMWLLAGAVMLPFIQFQTVIPLTAWVAPILIMRFTRTQRGWVGLPVLAVVGYVTTLIAMRGGVIPAGNPYLFALPGLALAISYGADKLLGPHLGRATRTLVFPSVETAIAFLAGIDRGSPFGSWGAIGYSQVENPSLLQLTSVSGVWGLGFLVLWTAPVINDLWTRRVNARPVAIVFAAVLLTTMLFGGARIAFPPSSETVRIAALAPDRELDTARGGELSGPSSEAVIDDLLARTRTAAHEGAAIVVWSEAAVFVAADDEHAFSAQAQSLANREEIYLGVGLVVGLPGDGYPSNENRFLLFGPDGDLLWDYHKATEVLGDGNRPGPGILPVVDTPYGKLSGLICFDSDFPALVQQAGRAEVDILLIPSSDWKSIAEMHAAIAVTRAVENGVSVVRPTRRGVSVVVDHLGSTLARSDFFTSQVQTVLADVPVKGAWTPYRLVGEGVGYGSAVAFSLLGGFAWVSHRRRQSATTFEQNEEE
jgi:apolipoprotein N-acyltransferase